MDKQNISSKPLDNPQISQTPYRFHAHVALPRKKSYKVLLRRLTAFFVTGISALILISAIIIVPGKYKLFCQQNPESNVCRPFITPSATSAKSVAKEPDMPAHQAATNQVASLKMSAQQMPVQQEKATPTPEIAASQPIQTAPTAIPTPEITQTGKFALQIGASQDKTEAMVMVEKAKGLGLGARIIQISIPNKGLWYRIQVGRFVDRNSALQAAQQLRAKKLLNDFLVTDFQVPNI